MTIRDWYNSGGSQVPKQNTLQKIRNLTKLIQMRFLKNQANPSPNTDAAVLYTIHCCLSKKYKMGIQQLTDKRLQHFFAQKIYLSWMYNERWVCWWYLVVTYFLLLGSFLKKKIPRKRRINISPISKSFSKVSRNRRNNISPISSCFQSVYK